MTTEWNRQKIVYSGDAWTWDVSLHGSFIGWDSDSSGWDVPLGPFLREELEYGEIAEEEA